ncbi:MAG: aminoglycoside phosphotransferase family protein [Clostridia bacterium]|nr:aminoglycoside phosphotransferase family protein [Clostridia bacterium]
MQTQNDFFRNQAEQFEITGKIVSTDAYGSGHINDTVLVVAETGDGQKRYILQKVNSNVFKKPEQVLSNIEKVTAFLKVRANSEREVLSLIPTKDGNTHIKDENGNLWRMYNFIEDSVCLDTVESKQDFYECAYAFGKFQRDLRHFPAETLYETIPNFHNTPIRFGAFLSAVSADKCGRAKNVKDEIDFITERQDFYSVLIDAEAKGDLPVRVTHNDTKSNNVMLDKNTRKALCVIDLDTIMPGYSVTDFGDAIRFGASTAAEDEKDLDKVHFSLDLFKAYTEGYLAGCDGKLKPTEIMLMPEGSKMMTIECGMRFLTDYLNGDTYFKIAYSDHNLVRARTQLKLVKEMEEQWDDMKAVVRQYANIKD